MGDPYTGGCACGEIRYTVIGEPAVMVQCQCRQCQRDSGTGHGCHLTFVGAEAEVNGTAREWHVTGDDGTRKSRAFCGTCGAPVFMTFPDNPAIFIPSAASLDDPSRFQPQIVTWADAAQPWDRVDEGLTKFQKMPPSP